MSLNIKLFRVSGTRNLVGFKLLNLDNRCKYKLPINFIKKQKTFKIKQHSQKW